MNEREQRISILHQLIIEGYSRNELYRMIKNDEFNWGIQADSTIYSLISDARKLCKIDTEESDLLYERLLSIYKGSMKKGDYGNALKAYKELREFSNTENNDIEAKEYLIYSPVKKIILLNITRTLK